MRRKIFCAGLVVAAAFAPAGRAAAQQVPGRDLLRFPIGIGAESPALGTGAGAELWNPAAGAPTGSARAVVGAAALDGPQELGLSEQLLSARIRVGASDAVSTHVSIVRGAVDGLVRTETDPQTVADKIPYSTLVISVGVAARRERNVTVGGAVRYRSGRMDRTEGATAGVDLGIVADSLLGGRARAGASTFLLRPASPRGEGATYVAGADVRAWRRAGLAEVRLGYAATGSRAAPWEHYGVATLRSHGVDAIAGVLHTRAYGAANIRPRLGVGLHYARYVVGIAREETGAGLDPTYQFMLSTKVQ